MGRWGQGLAAAFALALTACAGSAVGPPGSGTENAQRADLLIRGGTVYDGVSEAGRRADVAVLGDRVLLIGDAGSMPASRIIDARGMIVAPGFVDPHTHSDEDILSPDRERRFMANHLLQGVTTVFVGNDGGGAPEVRRRFEAIQASGAGANVAAFVGFGAVRRRILGEADRAPTVNELTAMRGLVASAMCEGALGLSAGLYYPPQSFARTDEVIALAREAATRGGVYETHLRDEGTGALGLLGAIDEALAIGTGAGLPVHIAHIKALGVEAHGQAPAAIARIEAARRAGLRVSADHYPWTASGTRLTALVPDWAQAGGREALRVRIADLAVRPRLESEVASHIIRRGGPGSILITGGVHRGQRLDVLAQSWSITPAAAALRVIAEGDAPIASFNMRESDLLAFRARPWVVTGSDASAGHPRRFGSFARAWRLFVRERPVLTRGGFIRRSSGLTASLFGLAPRGTLRTGGPADLVVFDPATFAERADYDEPVAPATGVLTVLVNGALAVDQGRPTGTLAGRPLPRPVQHGSCPN